MIVTDISADLIPPYPERIRSEADELGLERSPGLHLSQIIDDLEHAIRPKDEWCDEEELAFYAAGGFLWEKVFARCHADSIMNGDIIRPGEFTLDGIIGSPDLIRVSDWTILECKHPWKSVRKFDDHLEKYFWKWVTQVACYAKMIGTNTAEIHAYFVCGDWRPPIPQTRSIRLEFTDRELDERWFMVRSHAQRKGWLI